MGVDHGAARVLSRQREVGDLVRGLDEAAQKRGALDDRGVRLGVRDGRHVLHEADEELRAADLVELAASSELRLDALEAERLAPLGDTFDGAEDEAVLFARSKIEEVVRVGAVAPSRMQGGEYAELANTLLLLTRLRVHGTGF